jgi:hypothetical protein
LLINCYFHMKKQYQLTVVRTSMPSRIF